MKLETKTKKELIQYIREETVTVDKYNRLQKKLEVYKADIAQKDEKVAELEKAKVVFDNTIRAMEDKHVKLRKSLEDQANKIIAQQTAGVTGLKTDLAYTEGVLEKNFEMLINVREYSNFQHNMVNKIIDTYTNTIAKIEITDKEKGGK